MPSLHKKTGLSLPKPLSFPNLLLDQAIERYLSQIDDLGSSLADLLVSDELLVGLGGAMAALAAGAVVFECQRRSRSHPVSLVDGEGMIPQWFLESISRG
jgi:hypothetical protein